MYKEEAKMLQLLEDVASLGFCSATLHTNAKLNNNLATAMVECGRRLLRHQSFSVGEPIDHFANEAAMDMLKYLDRLLALPLEDRLPYFRTCVKNVFFRYIKTSAHKNHFQHEIPVVSLESTEQTILQRESLALFMHEASLVLTLREFFSFFYVRVIGFTPSDLETMLQSYGQSTMTQKLIKQLCDLYRIPPEVFDPMVNKQERKGGLCARSITQAIQRAEKKLRKLAVLLL
jgi:hypothetical protein